MHIEEFSENSEFDENFSENRIGEENSNCIEIKAKNLTETCLKSNG